MLAKKRDRRRESVGGLGLTMPTRAIVATVNGMETPGGGLGLAGVEALIPLVGGLLPGITGQQAGSTFTAATTAWAQADVQRAQAKRAALLGGAAVTVVGLGLLTYFLVRR